MPPVLQPNTLSAELAEMKREIRELKATALVGLNRNKVSWSTLDADETVADAFTDGTATARTWLASDGTSGTGYPKATITGIGIRCAVLVSGALWNMGDDATFRSTIGVVGVGVNGANPVPTSTLRGGEWFQFCVTEVDISVTFVGQHVTTTETTDFRIMSKFTTHNPGALRLPQLNTPVLTILPLN